MNLIHDPNQTPETRGVPDPESEAVIERFLAETGGAVTDSAAPADWHDEVLPEGHRSGFVAVIGRPNVGKSTLVNALVGHKVAIVSPKPQTTRTRVTGILTQPDHQIIFLDTPGIHKQPGFKLNQMMIDTAVATIPAADVILFMVDISAKPKEEDEIIARLLKEKAGKSPVIFVLNKMDQLAMARAEERIQSYWTLLPDYADSVPTSALHGTNLDVLHTHLLKFLQPGPRYYPGDQITDQTHYMITGELIREALLRHTHEEVPHATAVLVEDYEERENGVVYIAANIWVERDSQKPIIIGKGGQRLKQVGQIARAELERFVGGKVYLDLWVKVKPKWRDKDARLRELGY